MHRIDTSGHVGNLFSDGTPGVSQATVVDDDILNAFQEEIVNAVLDSGQTLAKGVNTQLSGALAQLLPPGGRLTLTTAVPVTTADVSGATTVRYAPYRSNKICLYDGTRWRLYTFTELSQATSDTTKSPAAVANNSNYDVFAWNDAGTLRATRGPAWTSDTARGTGAGTTELEYFEGRWVNKVAVTNGPAARAGLYVGTIRSNGSAAIDDTLARRMVWNTYNRVPRAMRVNLAATNWTHNGSYRQANADGTKQLDMVIGLSEDEVVARALHHGDGTSGNAFLTAIGVDSTTVDSGLCSIETATGAGLTASVSASWEGYPGIGRHFLAHLEATQVGTITFRSGGEGGGSFNGGIHGRVMG